VFDCSGSKYVARFGVAHVELDYYSVVDSEPSEPVRTTARKYDLRSIRSELTGDRCT
jgi:hypothetical protein